MIRISESAKKVIAEHAIRDFPNECVGFFYGSDNGERTIIEAKIVKNSKEGDQRRRFEISPKTYMDAEKFALENNMDLLGVYHSHPLHPAIPSEHDRKQAVPYFSYIIVSENKNREVTEFTSWRLNEEQQFEEETINEIK